jgi:hypothetical protein
MRTSGALSSFGDRAYRGSRAGRAPASSKSAETVKPRRVHFEDIAAVSGLNGLNVFGGVKHKEFIIETTGNGAIIFDYDNDG